MIAQAYIAPTAPIVALHPIPRRYDKAAIRAMLSVTPKQEDAVSRPPQTFNHQNKRAAAGRYDWSKHLPNHPAGFAEDDCPWWNAEWFDHCSPEAEYVEAPQQITTSAPVALLPDFCESTPPLVRSAYRKAQEMLLIGSSFAETAPVFNGGKAQLALVTDKADYDKTMAAYNARCDAPKNQDAQRAWNTISAASVLATRTGAGRAGPLAAGGDGVMRADAPSSRLVLWRLSWLDNP